MGKKNRVTGWLTVVLVECDLGVAAGLFNTKAVGLTKIGRLDCCNGRAKSEGGGPEEEGPGR